VLERESSTRLERACFPRVLMKSGPRSFPLRFKEIIYSDFNVRKTFKRLNVSGKVERMLFSARFSIESTEV